MKQNVIWIAAVCLILLGSCRQSSGKSDGEEPLVRTGEYCLYRSDLETVLPVGVHGADSARLAEKYIREWVEDILLYQQAEENLPDNEEINERVEAYRRSLTVHLYQEQLVEQELGSRVTDGETEAYYNAHQGQFVAVEPYLKGVFMKVPLRTPSLNALRNWMKTPSGDNLDRLEKYGISHAVSYECFPAKWRPVSEVSLLMPLTKADIDNLRQRKTLEVTDSSYRYLLHVCEVLPAGGQLPLEYAAGEIKEILVNLKRAEYVLRMKEDLYMEALDAGKIIYY